MKYNFFWKKGFCWKCGNRYLWLVLTKYHGVLCKRCYNQMYNETKKLYYSFFNSFEIEFDTSLEEYTRTLFEMVEYIHTCYKSTKDFEFAEQYTETIEKVKKIYNTLEEIFQLQNT